TIADYNYKL
nr:Chain C, SARS-CoV-2 Spike-derived peptide S417-425 K417T mutant (TIADYNYKL) [Severe acute respiratory syndrome coronavirus 2]